LERRKTLLLPELAHENESVAVFSDYGGESKDSKCFTYSFLVCAWNQTGMFASLMKYLRGRHCLRDKEISFKDLRYGPINRALDDYLSALNFVPGLLCTVIIEKGAASLVGHKTETGEILEALKKNDVGEWKPAVAEKLLRVCHVSAYLVALLASKGQKVFWMTDHDAIAANELLAEYWLKLFANLLSHYCREDLSFIGGGRPFEGKHLETLDLLSSADIVAGCVEHYYTRTSNGREDMKEEVGKVLRWLCHDGILLKKQLVTIMKADTGGVIAGSVNLELADPDVTKVRIPVVRP
jgi:NTP pyrophosphatase (non-canonical NTP hydrolase)